MASFHFRDYNRKIGRRHLITPLSGNLAIKQRRKAPANSLNSGALYFAGISYYSFPVLRGQRLETRLTQSPDDTCIQHGGVPWLISNGENFSSYNCDFSI